MALETKQVLITVKAYPNPSKRYIETVCCAGIDLNTGSWIRLYPIPYRDLDVSRKFKKYSIIEVRCWKAPDDKRPESYKVDADTITIIRQLDTKNKWKSRGEIMLPTISPSFCHILAKSELKHGKSLGMFKPTEVEFSSKPVKVTDQQLRDACYAQLSFFDKHKNTIERIPFDFYYHFRCADAADCPGHKLLIIDWEIGQAFRDWQKTYKTEHLLLAKIRQRWLDLMCADHNDVHFYVGNMQRFHNQFMVLGVFYPKK